MGLEEEGELIAAQDTKPAVRPKGSITRDKTHRDSDNDYHLNAASINGELKRGAGQRLTARPLV